MPPEPTAGSTMSPSFSARTRTSPRSPRKSSSSPASSAAGSRSPPPSRSAPPPAIAAASTRRTGSGSAEPATTPASTAATIGPAGLLVDQGDREPTRASHRRVAADPRLWPPQARYSSEDGNLKRASGFFWGLWGGDTGNRAGRQATVWIPAGQRTCAPPRSPDNQTEGSQPLPFRCPLPARPEGSWTALPRGSLAARPGGSGSSTRRRTPGQPQRGGRRPRPTSAQPLSNKGFAAISVVFFRPAGAGQGCGGAYPGLAPWATFCRPIRGCAALVRALTL